MFLEFAIISLMLSPDGAVSRTGSRSRCGRSRVSNTFMEPDMGMAFAYLWNSLAIIQLHGHYGVIFALNLWLTNFLFPIARCYF